MWRQHLTKALPWPVQAALGDFLPLLDRRAPGLLAGYYLIGSVALDAFDAAKSDLDFIAVLRRDPGPEDTSALAAAHRETALRHPKPPFEGTYHQWRDLGRASSEIAPCPSYHDGVLHATGRHGICAVNWWLLKHHAIAVAGPPPDSLGFAIAWDALVEEMVVNLNTYWLGQIRDPRRLAWLLSDFGVEWDVLGVSRLLYSFREGDITSKVGAGEYALRALPRRWHRVLEEALRLRRHGREGLYRCRLRRAADAVAYVKYAIHLGNDWAHATMSPVSPP